MTTSGGTLVVIPHASPGQLQAGATIVAVGHPGPDGTLSARAVAAVSQLPAGGHLNERFRVRDCSPSSIDEALGAISAAPASAWAIRQHPDDGWHRYSRGASHRSARTRAHRLSQREAESADVDPLAGGDRSAGREPDSYAAQAAGDSPRCRNGPARRNRTRHRCARPRPGLAGGLAGTDFGELNQPQPPPPSVSHTENDHSPGC